MIPTLNYSDGTFHLWETNTWTSEPWSSKNGFFTVLIFLLVGELSKIRIIRFHSLYIETSDTSQVIEKIAWDASGERLAVSHKDGDEQYKGLVAVFDVKRTPLISTSLVEVLGTIQSQWHFHSTTN
ncbi:aladin-like [Salvia hispanica]|uniref:aladin-like n=1 Tax=Salvia hispanica TaxID=49212 RepID=UPI0020098BA6|nr:aladin-like [Salvia hispanica]XP_047969823.1 aladin-like [Salvia hispanica]